eukprot:g15387.t1
MGPRQTEVVHRTEGAPAAPIASSGATCQHILLRAFVLIMPRSGARTSGSAPKRSAPAAAPARHAPPPAAAPAAAPPAPTTGGGGMMCRPQKHGGNHSCSLVSWKVWSHGVDGIWDGYRGGFQHCKSRCGCRTLLESALCALNVALDMFVSCVLSCISLPLATGSLLISGFGRLGFLEKSWEKAKAPRIQARQDTSDDSSPLELNIEDAQPEGLVGKSSSSGSSSAALLGRSSYPDHEYTELGCRGSRGGVVKLNIYDVSHESSIQNLNVFLAHPMSPFKFGGVFHAGVEIGGKEWSFGDLLALVASVRAAL